MKARLSRGFALPLSVLLFAGHCSFFNFKPADALAGREAGFLLATAAVQGWFAGGSLYSSSVPVNLELGRDESLSGNTILIYDITPGFAGIENRLFYRRSAVADCQEQVFAASLAVTYAMYDGGPQVPSHDTVFAAAIAAAGTAANCPSMEAGEYVDLAPLPIAY
jgi:small lipoprotein (TIGR04452 family)